MIRKIFEAKKELSRQRPISINYDFRHTFIPF
jgi:hypothetical protein